MIKKWKGWYKYDSSKVQELIGHPCTYFTLEMEILEDDTLKGTVQDDKETGGMSGIGTFSGEIHNNYIYFEKQMPHKSVLDRKGIHESKQEKHPLIIYEGQKVNEKKYQGTWCFEKQRRYLFGFIPFKYSPGKGTWEMEWVEN